MQYHAAILPFKPQDVLVVEIDQEESYDTELLKEKMRIFKTEHPDTIVMLMYRDALGSASYIGNRQVADILVNKDDDKFPWQTYHTG